MHAIVSTAELLAIEEAANACRLSLVSFARVALINAAEHPERLAEWQAIAERIRETGEDQGQKRPGRPRKSDDDGGSSPPSSKKKRSK